MRKITDLLEAMHNEQSIEFEEFLQLLESYGELEFYYKCIKYGVLRLNDDYTRGKDQEWHRSKDYYVIYEANNAERGWTYKNIEGFALHANINGALLKDIWTDVKNLNELDCSHYHGCPGTHEHLWFGDERGPALCGMEGQGYETK